MAVHDTLILSLVNESGGGMKKERWKEERGVEKDREERRERERMEEYRGERRERVMGTDLTNKRV